MDTKAIEKSIQSKVIVIREGSRGWRLGACFIEDALSLPGLDVDSENFVVPSEDDENYTEIVQEMCDDLEGAINNVGYDVVWDDGYVIYKDLTDEEAEYLNS